MSKGHLESPFASLIVAYTVESGEGEEDFLDPPPTSAFYISVQSSRPTWSGKERVLRIALSPCFTGSNKTLLRGERKVG